MPAAETRRESDPSTQVFMTRRDALQTIHEPFGDAFYYGPERMGIRYEADEQVRRESGFADSSFQSILDRIAREAQEVRRFHVTGPRATVGVAKGV
nr:hypothetical protein CFP56_13457 [Quercus suber]